MDIQDVIRLRAEKEANIRFFVDREIRDFSEKTGLGVRDVDIHMFEFCIRDSSGQQNLSCPDSVHLDVRL
jgi:hypothetical protein